MPDSFEARRQHMLYEALDERRPVDVDRSLAALIVGANAQPHALGVDADDAFAREVVEHCPRQLNSDHAKVSDLANRRPSNCSTRRVVYPVSAARIGIVVLHFG